MTGAPDHRRFPTFTRHADPVNGDYITVDSFPPEFDVSAEFLQTPFSRWVQFDGDTLTFTLRNGERTYERISEEAGGVIRFARVDEA